MKQFMITPTSPTSLTCRLLLASIIVLLSIVCANAQTSATDSSTPVGLASGAPAGSHQLSGFDNINFFNGNLNFNLPLLKVGGRGGVQDTIGLTLEQKWKTVTTPQGADFLIWPVPYTWEGLEVGYGPGVLIGRFAGIPTNMTCQGLSTCDGQEAAHSLLRLTFKAADGTEYELLDTKNGGAPGINTTCYQDCVLASAENRGKEFVSRDGTSATFISDVDLFDGYADMREQLFPSGYLLLRDGTRYRIENGLVMWTRDRNGNKMTFAYYGGRVTQITDSLGRVVTIGYASPSLPSSDTITYKGFGNVSRTIRVWRDLLYNSSTNNSLRSGYTLKSYYDLFPLNGASSGNFNPTVVTSVELPNGQSYRFKYNSYGELARVELPTGGAMEYDHDGGLAANSPGLYNGGGYHYPQQIYRRVVERRVYADSGTTWQSRMTISKPEENGTNVGYAVVENRDFGGALLTRELHYYYGTAKVDTLKDPTEPDPWKTGREWKTEVFDSNGATLLRRAEQTWQQPAVGYTWPLTVAETNDAAGQNNPQITQTVTTLADTNQVAKQTFLYDKYCNRTDSYEYDYGSGAAGSLLRRTHTDYLTTNGVNGVAYDTVNPNSTYPDVAATVHLRSLPTQSQVFDAGGVEKARTTFEYDNYANDGNHALLVDRGSISGLDGAFTTANDKRGNLTKATSWILSTSTPLNAYAQYDIAGNVVKAIDARGYATSLYYDDCFGAPDGNAQLNSAPIELSSAGKLSYAFVTSATDALNHTSYSQFDYYAGRAVDAKDVNGIVSSSYSDSEPLDRPTKVIRAVNTSVQNQTLFSYDDANHIVSTTSDLNNNTDQGLVGKVLYDGLGRTTETRQYEGGTNYIDTQQQYDALGRVYRTSNPFRPWQSESALWTTTAFDALSRVTSITTPDSAPVTTSYSGNTVTVTDQAGKARKSVTDGLGRLTSVYEDPSGSNYQTSYGYDVLDDLTTVSQGSQTRTFVYDSLKRLTSAANPESGTSSYTYDNNGNLFTRLDARNITTTFVYDALNRPTSRSYNDSPQTPTVSYFYDSQSLPSGAPSFTRGSSTGRLVAVTYGSGSSAGTYRGYDELGRVIRQYQQTDSVNYLVEATYWANSALKDETYPSVPGYGDRRVVSFTNDAAGRLGSLTSNATTYAPATSVSSIGYASHNALKTETYGNSLIHAVTYNNRLQANEIKLGTSGAPTSMLDLNYNYGTTNNNGNVQSITYAGGGLSYTQSFGYDALNRLTTSQENSGSSWSETNGYDQYGNRWIDYGGGNHNLSFSTSTNRITTSGFSYDAVGNLTNDTIHSYTFDAENKVSKVDNVSAYVYDGEGQRVRKLVGENLRFIYDMHGQQVAEFDGSSGVLKKEYVYGASGLVATVEPTAVNANGTRYTTSDNLGTPRVVTNASAAVVSRHDYMPFGQELGAGVGGRTNGMGFIVADGVRQKFTQKERDNETGLDYFGARYFASTQGRFISVDPLGSSAIVSDPQSFNRYIYVLNNPLRFVDPDGMDAKNPWADLTNEERILLASKFTQVKSPGNPTQKELTAAGNIFNQRVQATDAQTGELDEKQTAINFKTVRNFVDQLGDDSRVWSQVKSIDKVEVDPSGGSSGIYFTVNNDKDFVSAMRQATGSSGSEMFVDTSRIDGHVSIRQVGADYDDASLHVGKPNDTQFGAHWDPTSSITQSTLLNSGSRPVMEGIGSGLAGAVHWFSGHASPDRVRAQIMREHQAPRTRIR